MRSVARDRLAVRAGASVGVIDKGKTDEIPVLTIIDSESGEARSQVVADVTGRSLRRVISENVEMAESVLHTDSWNCYTTLGQEFSDDQAGRPTGWANTCATGSARTAARASSRSSSEAWMARTTT